MDAPSFGKYKKNIVNKTLLLQMYQRKPITLHGDLTVVDNGGPWSQNELRTTGLD